MTKHTRDFTKYHRYELVHGDDADFIAYQRHLGDGVWQTLSNMDDPARRLPLRRSDERSKAVPE